MLPIIFKRLVRARVVQSRNCSGYLHWKARSFGRLEADFSLSLCCCVGCRLIVASAFPRWNCRKYLLQASRPRSSTFERGRSWCCSFSPEPMLESLMIMHGFLEAAFILDVIFWASIVLQIERYPTFTHELGKQNPVMDSIAYPSSVFTRFLE